MHHKTTQGGEALCERVDHPIVADKTVVRVAPVITKGVGKDGARVQHDYIEHENLGYPDDFQCFDLLPPAFESGMQRLALHIYREPLEGHTRAMCAVVYTLDGRRIISGSMDRTIRIWDAETGVAFNKPLEGHTEGLQCIACSPNVRHIISGSIDTTIQIWDPETGAAFGKPLGGHSARCLLLFPPMGGTSPLHPLTGPFGYGMLRLVLQSGCLSKAALPLSPLLLTLPMDCISSLDLLITIPIWDAQTGALIANHLKGHSDIVQFVAYSPNGQHFVSGSAENSIRVWNSIPPVSTRFPSCNPMHTHFYVQPYSKW